jgi:GMP synthase-like glutamine amidotransferase
MLILSRIPAKPIAICQHESSQGPAFLATFLQQQQVPFQIFAPGEQRPDSLCDFSALIVLGSNHSVHDRDIWVRQETWLVQDALHRHKPVLGHCFGGQLLAKVLGASVHQNPCPHIGFDLTYRSAAPAAQLWFGANRQFQPFYWHQEYFGLPAGATRLLYNRFCQNSGFVYGPHLALQCHLEVTAQSVQAWINEDAAGLAQAQAFPGVHASQTLLAQLSKLLPPLHQLASRVYRRWLAQIPALHPQLASALHLSAPR